MTRTFDARKSGFEEKLASYLMVAEGSNAALDASVFRILESVKKQGNSALLGYIKDFDGADFNTSSLKVTEAEIGHALEACPKPVLKALKISAKRIKSYHKKQLPKDALYTDEIGLELGWRWTALESVGIYVPGGTATYPSSVLMNAIPASVAGVKKLVMVTPVKQGGIAPVILAAAHVAGVEEIYKVGGAQAIAALAYGTTIVPKVDKIIGPGNAYVASAKRQVFGLVGIDTVAGPSEILVVADSETPATWVAADLLSQAEHDKEARSIFITNDSDYAEAVEREIETILPTLPREEIARASWEKNGLIIIVDHFKEAPRIIDQIAPEHLLLSIKNAKSLIKKIKNAGAIFVGKYSPEALGDYMAGPSHVLPTSGAARFSSGISVYDFMKKSSIIHARKKPFRKLAKEIVTLADAEGLEAHSRSVSIRLEEK